MAIVRPLAEAHPASPAQSFRLNRKRRPMPLRVLLIEDSSVTAKIVRSYVEVVSPESSTEWATTLAEGEARLREDEFDLVITDLNLPDSGALATLDRVIAATDRLVVVLTSVDEPAMENEVIARGVYDFLPKSSLSRRTLGHVLRLATIQAETLRSLQRTVAERDAQSRQLDYLTQHDRLTGLANRSLFCTRVGDAIDGAQRQGEKLALGLLDVERFRAVNEVGGVAAGDALLRELAGRLARAIGVAAAARVGPDRFAFLIQPVRGISEAERIARQVVRDCFVEPFGALAGAIEATARIGVARYPADAPQAEALLARAEDALRQAKSAGETLTFYAPEMTRWTRETVTLESRLRRALEREEFELHYQPKVSARSGAIVGLEGLLRWRAPGEGPVSPARFIPLMEETGMILEAGDWVLRRAIADHGRWGQLGLPVPRVAVNVSALQLRRPEFVARVLGALQGARCEGAAAPALDLEITESCAMQGIEANIEKLRELSGLGLQFAIDDFGTGYSSLAYLARLPVHQLKIDRAFVSAMLGDEGTQVVVKTIIGLGRALGVGVVAEGVETPAQASHLRELGCDELQGYLFGRPMSFSDVARLLDQHRPAR